MLCVGRVKKTLKALEGVLEVVVSLGVPGAMAGKYTVRLLDGRSP